MNDKFIVNAGDVSVTPGEWTDEDEARFADTERRLAEKRTASDGAAETGGGLQRLAVALRLLAKHVSGMSMDAKPGKSDRWITVHPGGEGKGRPVLIGANGVIKGGMGGKFNGQRIDKISKRAQKAGAERNARKKAKAEKKAARRAMMASAKKGPRENKPANPGPDTRKPMPKKKEIKWTSSKKAEARKPAQKRPFDKRLGAAKKTVEGLKGSSTTGAAARMSTGMQAWKPVDSAASKRRLEQFSKGREGLSKKDLKTAQSRSEALQKELSARAAYTLPEGMSTAKRRNYEKQRAELLKALEKPSQAGVVGGGGGNWKKASPWVAKSVLASELDSLNRQYGVTTKVGGEQKDYSYLDQPKPKAKPKAKPAAEKPSSAGAPKMSNADAYRRIYDFVKEKMKNPSQAWKKITGYSEPAENAREYLLRSLAKTAKELGIETPGIGALQLETTPAPKPQPKPKPAPAPAPAAPARSSLPEGTFENAMASYAKVAAEPYGTEHLSPKDRKKYEAERRDIAAKVADKTLSDYDRAEAAFQLEKLNKEYKTTESARQWEKERRDAEEKHALGFKLGALQDAFFERSTLPTREQVDEAVRKAASPEQAKRIEREYRKRLARSKRVYSANSRLAKLLRAVHGKFAPQGAVRFNGETFVEA